jgi:hypothetical protein
LRSALLIVMDVAVFVVAVGGSAGADVVKLKASPIESPVVLIATTRKKYATPPSSPESVTLIVWLVVPEPAACVGVLLYVVIEESVPHSNHAVVARPFGVTFPFRVAPAAPTEVADKVVAVGAAPGVKLKTDPRVVPDPLLAATRK